MKIKTRSYGIYYEHEKIFKAVDGSFTVEFTENGAFYRSGRRKVPVYAVVSRDDIWDRIEILEVRI